MKIKLWPKDASSTVEKVVYVVAEVGVAFLMFFLYASALGIFNNMIGDAGRAAGWGWRIAGLALMAGQAWFVKKMIADEQVLGVETNSFAGIITLFVSIILVVNTLVGFHWPIH